MKNNKGKKDGERKLNLADRLRILWRNLKKCSQDQGKKDQGKEEKLKSKDDASWEKGDLREAKSKEDLGEGDEMKSPEKSFNLRSMAIFALFFFSFATLGAPLMVDWLFPDLGKTDKDGNILHELRKEVAFIPDFLEVLKAVDSNEKASIVYSPGERKLELVFSEVDPREKSGAYITRVTESQANQVAEIAAKREVSYVTATPPDSWMVMIFSWLPFLLILGLFFYLRHRQEKKAMSMIGGATGANSNFGKIGDKQVNVEEIETTFADVAGLENAKEQLGDIVKFLRDPKSFSRLGARIPTGVLFVGSPGNGKTFLARAVAGEAGVPFFVMSGSDFIEMYVGVGASRVRDLFAQAKENAPCIIFIDEADSIERRTSGPGGSGEDRKLVNQLLTEMDGFRKDGLPVVVMMATNFPEGIDPALLRPGRLELRVEVEAPGREAREEAFRIYTRKAAEIATVSVGELFEKLDYEYLSRISFGFSFAQIESMVNEATLLAARSNAKVITEENFIEARDIIVLGPASKGCSYTQKDFELFACHEAGHALVSCFIKGSQPIDKVTCIPRGGTGGTAWFLPRENKAVFKDEHEADLAVVMGGRVAEELIYSGKFTPGAKADIKNATTLAIQMVTEWGMDKEIGCVFRGVQVSNFGVARVHSEETATLIDERVKTLIDNARYQANKVLKNHFEILKALMELLLKEETISGGDVHKLIASMHSDFKNHPNYIRDHEDVCQ